MFHVGPFELLVIFVVALLVIGPEKLPGAVRTGSLWVGRFRRSFHKIKAEIEQELNADEIRRQLHNESILKDVEDVKKNVTSATNEVSQLAKGAEKSVRELTQDETDLRLVKKSASTDPVITESHGSENSKSDVDSTKNQA